MECVSHAYASAEAIASALQYHKDYENERSDTLCQKFGIFILTKKVI
jgi:hypothetical protein